ncbi:MAG: hypothetical protein MUP03_03285, partial [Anaerolineales bacterium]|nr:hypothetical protein [Anaerolineales bacterium]
SPGNSQACGSSGGKRITTYHLYISKDDPGLQRFAAWGHSLLTFQVNGRVVSRQLVVGVPVVR